MSYRGAGEWATSRGPSKGRRERLLSLAYDRKQLCQVSIEIYPDPEDHIKLQMIFVQLGVAIVDGSLSPVKEDVLQRRDCLMKDIGLERLAKRSARVKRESVKKAKGEEAEKEKEEPVENEEPVQDAENCEVARSPSSVFSDMGTPGPSLGEEMLYGLRNLHGWRSPTY